MRLVTYRSDGQARVAGLRQGAYVDLKGADPAVPVSIRELLAQGPVGLERAARALATGPSIEMEASVLLPPIPDPRKVICVGANYADHARESGMRPPSEPVIFNKFPTTIRKDGDPIVLPRASRQVDYEAELVVVMGRGGRRIAESEAMSHVAGYLCGNDVSARDWQKGKPAGQWLLGKSFDSFAPIGPWLVTADEVPDPGNLRIRLRLNGRLMQDSNTSQLIFPIPRLIAYVSEVCTLEPGDLLFTGTPAGVGMARKPPVYLKPGDVVEVEIDRLGVLPNPVIADSD